MSVKDGKISAVRHINGEASLANLTHAAHLLTGLSSILDYGDLIIAPGLIDTHVHMNQPGRTDWEGAESCVFSAGWTIEGCNLTMLCMAGMETATKAAAAGGITTIIDMPLNNDPAITEASLVVKKIRAAWVRVMVGFFCRYVCWPAGLRSCPAIFTRGRSGWMWGCGAAWCPAMRTTLTRCRPCWTPGCWASSAS